MKPFTDHRRFLWLSAVTVLLVGFIIAALVLPSTSDPSLRAGPSVRVPAMQNVPPSDRSIQVEVRESDAKQP